MSIDKLQEKIRKLKNPLIVDFSMKNEHIPEVIRNGRTEKEALSCYCRELLTVLKGVVPSVRFCFDQWALLDGLSELSALLKLASGMGYYVLLDGPSVLTPWAAERAAGLLSQESAWPCDGMIVSPYIGSDAMRHFLAFCKQGKSVFFAVRCPNRSASELQDLMTGSRLVYTAAAEQVDRMGQSHMGKCGYSHVAALTAGTQTNAVMGLRGKHKQLFLLVDGLDYPGGNGKIGSYGFDKLGHGCALSVGPIITAAWNAEGSTQSDYLEAAVQAVQRVRNNMARYVTIL